MPGTIQEIIARGDVTPRMVEHIMGASLQSACEAQMATIVPPKPFVVRDSDGVPWKMEVVVEATRLSEEEADMLRANDDDDEG